MSREFNYLKLPCLKFKRGREWWAWPLESGKVTPGSLQSHAFRNKCNMHSETNAHLKLSIVLYSWARPLTSIVPLSDQEFKWVLLIYQGKPMKCLRVTHDWLHWQLPFRRNSNTPSHFMLQKSGHLSSGTDLTYLYLYIKQTKTESANKASLQISQCSQYNFD